MPRATQGEHPKGVIGVATYFLGRYREFDMALNRVQAPAGTIVEWLMGINVAFNFNNMVRYVLENEGLEWLWILGDDHVFEPDLLSKLLDRDVDVVVPLCLRRSNPFLPVVQTPAVDGFKASGWEFLRGKTGCVDVTDSASLGNAGMLVKRKVLETCNKPWFANGQINPELNSSDLYFYENIKRNGFRIHLDVDNFIGHLSHMAVWPKRNDDGTYRAEIMAPF